jgi:glutathione S-transferase
MRSSGSDSIKLFARRTSSNCQKVLWFLGELGLEYEFVATGGEAGGLDSPAYFAINPNGRVPTLVDGDLAVWESHAILRYLAAAHAPARYWPEDPAERSRIDRWMDWSQAQFDPAFMALFWGYWRTPEADRDEGRNRAQIARCRRYLAILDHVLSNHAYVVGDRLSLADVPIGALTYRYANLGVTGEMPANVARWYAALTEREAFQTHVMLPFDELKGRLAP